MDPRCDSRPSRQQTKSGGEEARSGPLKATGRTEARKGGSRWISTTQNSSRIFLGSKHLNPPASAYTRVSITSG
uniref:Uncharacterized protein n=1 Tax=Mycena chlorophos TaxID=658473 RepID=A0ABQ0L4A3_MYCCL|nr:predicted protein [Mycena chlorophos]